MRLTRAQKVLLGLATAWPPTYIILLRRFYAATFHAFSAAMNGTGSLHDFPELPVPFLVHFLMGVLGVALVTTYVLHAAHNDKLGQNGKAIWAILLFFGNWITMPIYFCIHILPLRDDDGSRAGTTKDRKSADWANR
jgi:hypothetical protein